MSQDKSQKDVVIIAVITELQMFGTGKKSDTQIESPTEKKANFNPLKSDWTKAFAGLNPGKLT